MARALEFNNGVVDETANISSLISITGDYKVTVKFRPYSTSNSIFLGNQSSTSWWFGIFSGLQLSVPEGSISAGAIPTADVDYFAVAERIGTTTTVTLQDENQQVLSSNSGTTSLALNFDLIGNFPAGTAFSFDGLIYYIEWEQGGAVIHRHSADDSDPNSNPPILIDTVAANNATGINMTDANWIDLGGGDNTVDGAIALPSLQFSGSAEATAPDTTIDGAITLPSLQFSGSAEATAPGNTVDGAITLPSLQFSGSAEATAPDTTIDGAITLPSLQFSGSAEATAPDTTIDGAITLPSLQFSGSIGDIPSDFSIIVDTSVRTVEIGSTNKTIIIK